MSKARRISVAGIVMTFAVIAAAARPSASTAQDEKPPKIGDVVEVVTKIWGFAKTARELTKVDLQVEIKDPRSTTLPNVELGAVVTVPWEIDYSVKPAALAWLVSGAWTHYCRFKVTLDEKLVQEGEQRCEKGLNSPQTPVAGVLVRKWHCGQKDKPTLSVEAWIDRREMVRKYPGTINVPPGSGAFGPVSDPYFVREIRREERERKKEEVTFEVYSPFYFPVEAGFPAPGFKVDPGPPDGLHGHHAVPSQAVTATVKVEHDPRYRPPETTLGYHFDLIGGPYPWKYYTGAILADWLSTESHHHSTLLATQDQGTRGAQNTWVESMPHIGTEEPHHPGERTEAWRALMGATGKRTLRAWDGTAVPAEWNGQVRNGDTCHTDLSVRDADPGEH